jgi:YNFM family putative membrane transporter
MIKEFRCQHRAHQMACLRWSRAAIAVAIEASERIRTAGLQFSTEDVRFTIHSPSLIWNCRQVLSEFFSPGERRVDHVDGKPRAVGGCLADGKAFAVCDDVIGGAMTPGTRPSGGEHAPVLAPLAVLVSSALLVLSQLYLAIPLAPVIGHVLRADGSAAAAAMGTTYALAYGLGFLIFGPLSDRYGRKPILVPGMAVLSVITGGLAAASSLPVVAVLRAVQGLVAASFSAVALAYIGEGFPPRWRPTAIGAMSTAFLSAGILGQVYAQAVADALGWRWVFGLAAPAFVILAVALATILREPPRPEQPVSLGQKYRALRTLAVRRELVLVNASSFPVLLSLVGMYAALGPLLQTHFRLDQTAVLFVRLAGLPAMLLAPVAGWLIGRQGPTRVAIVGFLLAAIGLVAEAIAIGALWALVVGSVIFVLGVAAIIPSTIALVGSRGGSSRAGALAINGLVVFAGASCGPLAAQLPIGFSGLMVAFAVLLMIASGLVAISSRRTAEVTV